MPFIPIDKADDPRIAPFRMNERALASRAHKRDDSGAGLFLAEGDLVVERAIAAGCTPHSALADGDRMPAVAHALHEDGIDVFVGGDDVRRMVTGLGMPHPIVALFHRPRRPSPHELVSQCTRLVVVEGVDNPSNIGAIVRNVAGLGWDGLLLDHTSADPWSRRSLRAAMGTAFALPHARTPDLLAVLGSLTDMDLYALTPWEHALDIRSIPPTASSGRRRAVIVGSERAGLSPEVLAAAIPVRIPMAEGVDSLNAAAAVAVACYVLG